MRVFRAANDIFWLDTDAGYGSSALERLERFKLRTKLTLELTTVDVVALRGPESDATAASFPSAVAVDADWSTMSGVDLFSAEHQTMPHEIPEGPAEALELLRIRSGQPAMGSELGTNTIPAAAHIVDESVDFTKGCYVGQELVARIDSRGSATPKRLCSFTADSPVHDVAGPLLDADDAEIGEISSAAAAGDGSLVGLAYIKRAVDVPCTARATSLGGATMDVTVTPLPRA